MRKDIARRDVLRILSASAAVAWIGEPFLYSADNEVHIAGNLANVSVKVFSKRTVRITIAEQAKSAATPLASDGALVSPGSSSEQGLIPASAPGHAAPSHDALRVRITQEPLTVIVETGDGRVLQKLKIDEATGSVTFPLGEGPVLGLGEGGPQFDRRGDVDQMHSGQGGYHLRTNGGRVPIQWLIGTSGWAMFIHHPLGNFDLSGSDGVFRPSNSDAMMPLDIFVVDASDPGQAMSEYAQITGHPEIRRCGRSDTSSLTGRSPDRTRSSELRKRFVKRNCLATR